MLTSVLTLTVAATMGAGPYGVPSGAPSGPTNAVYSGPVQGGIRPACADGSCSSGGGGYDYSGGYAGGGYGGYSGGGAYDGNEPMFPYDNQYPWMHGYFQEMPAYGGFVGFRPYNYKHVMPQCQTAAGWGMSPTMPYSHQFWHRFQQQSAMSPQLTDNRSRQVSPVARNTFRPTMGPALRLPANVPASYVAPLDRAVAAPQQPIDRSTGNAGSANGFEPSQPQRFSRDNAETSSYNPRGGKLPAITPAGGIR